MNVLWLLHLFFAASQSESLLRFNWLSKNWKSHALDGDNDLTARNTIMRTKPKPWRNLFALKTKGQDNAALTTGLKVQGTASLRNGKVKLDLTLLGANHVKDPSATTAPASTLTSAPGSPSTAATTSGLTSASPPSTTGGPSSSVTAAPTSATTIGLKGSISTLPPSTTSASTTSAVTSGPTNRVTTAATSAKSTAAAITSSTPANGATSGPSTLATTSTPPTSLPPSTPASATTIATPVTGTTATTATMTTIQPSLSKFQSPGFLSKPGCETSINVDTRIVANELMKSHNAYRQTHASPALQLDGQMTCDAKKFAQEIASKGVLQHQKSAILARKRLGENIGMSCAPARNGPLSYGRIIKMAKNVAKRWYDEVCQYDFDKPNAVPNTGHFTEIVWSGTRKLGVGFAVGKNAKFPGYKCVYVVGRYKPAGNIIGGRRLEMNVKRGSFNRAYCQKRSTALHEDSWDKRYHLRTKQIDAAGRRSHIHSNNHLKHHFHNRGLV